MYKPLTVSDEALHTFSTVMPHAIAGHTGLLWFDETSLLLTNENYLILRLPLQEIRQATMRTRSAELALDTVTGEQYVLHTYGVSAKLLWLRRTLNFLVGIADILSTNHGGSNEVFDYRDHKAVLKYWAHELRQRGVSVVTVKGKRLYDYS